MKKGIKRARKETDLHAELKEWYGRNGGDKEQVVDGYIIDLVREDELVEIQTRSLGALKRKLASLLDGHVVRVVHPIALERWILRIDKSGNKLSRRKSPRQGNILHLFDELVNLRSPLHHPNLKVEVVFVHEEQVWLDDGQGSWRRKHWSLADRRLLGVAGVRQFSFPDDYLELLPAGLSEPWTTADLAQSLAGAVSPASTRRLAGKMAYVLREMGLIQQVGKSGRAYLYAKSKPPHPGG